MNGTYLTTNLGEQATNSSVVITSKAAVQSNNVRCKRTLLYWMLVCTSMTALKQVLFRADIFDVSI